MSLSKLTSSTKKNSLAIMYPHLINEWHQTKNIPLTSREQIWWICVNKHYFQAVINKRSKSSK